MHCFILNSSTIINERDAVKPALSSVRKALTTVRRSDAGDVEFCDSCSRTTDASARALAYRRQTTEVMTQRRF